MISKHSSDSTGALPKSPQRLPTTPESQPWHSGVQRLCDGAPLMSQGPSHSGLHTCCLLCLEPGSLAVHTSPPLMVQVSGCSATAWEGIAGRPAVPTLTRPPCAVQSFVTATMKTKRAHALLTACPTPTQTPQEQRLCRPRPPPGLERSTHIHLAHWLSAHPRTNGPWSRSTSMGKGLTSLS